MDIANYRFLCRFQQGLDILMTAFYAWMISCFVWNKGMVDMLGEAHNYIKEQLSAHISSPTHPTFHIAEH